MDLGLTGRTAVVTGASRGIGLAITRGLAAHGAHVVAGARRSSAELDQLAEEGSVRVLEVDLAAPDGPPRLIALADAGPDILINIVGSAPVRTGGFLNNPRLVRAETSRRIPVRAAASAGWRCPCRCTR